MLDEVAAERHVQHLAAAADGEHRHVAFEGRRQQGHLGRVAVQADPVRLRMRLGTVDVRIEVGAAGEDEPVERVERLVDAVVRGWDEERPPAGALDRVQVHGRDQRRRKRPGAPAHLGLGVGGDPDQGPRHVQESRRAATTLCRL